VAVFGLVCLLVVAYASLVTLTLADRGQQASMLELAAVRVICRLVVAG
jgi:hypothetical protein